MLAIYTYKKFENESGARGAFNSLRDEIRHYHNAERSYSLRTEKNGCEFSIKGAIDEFSYNDGDNFFLFALGGKDYRVQISTIDEVTREIQISRTRDV
jgi:hypothetical protein